MLSCAINGYAFNIVKESEVSQYFVNTIIYNSFVKNPRYREDEMVDYI